MAGNNRIRFDVDFNVKQEQLKSLKTELQTITNMLGSAKAGSTKIPLTNELEKAGETAQRLSSILDRSFNKDLGTVNITKFNSLLGQSNLSLQQVKANLEAQGSVGATAWNRLSSSIMSTNIQIRESSKLLNDMATTMTNTLKWGVASSILNTMSNSIKQAYNYSVQLDTSLNDIRIVTGDSADQMQRFAEQANTAAERLGSTTLDYTKTALGFYQQGLGDEAVAERTEASIKAANVTGTQAAQTAEYLTAVWNGFKAEIGTETEYVDKLAAVADSSASNLAELATAMSKTASVANNMGVNMDQLTAQIATVIATTRQAPETVGNAFKTIYARINDVKTGSEDAEVSLGNYTKIMGQLGYNVLDATGSLRDSGDVMQEIGDNWANMTREQQIYLAQTMAGKRQMNNLIALFDNWEKYSTLLNVSLEAQGTLDEKNNRYLESTRAHLNELKTAYQDLFATLMDNNEINAGIDTIKNLVSTIDGFLEGFGGGAKSILAFGSIVATIFRDQIGQAIGEAQVRQEVYLQNLERIQAMSQMTQLGGAKPGEDASPAQAGAYANQQAQLEIATRLYEVQRGLTQEQANQVIEIQRQIGLEAENAELAKQELQAQQQIMAGGSDELLQKIQKLDIEQSYLGFIESELGLEGETIQTLESKAAALKKIALEKEFVNSEGEEELLNDTKIKEIEQERTRVLQQIQQLKAAAAAEDAKDAQKGAITQQGQLQDRANDILDAGEKIALAKAQTDLWTTSISSLTMMLGTASSLIRTWGDENASLGDKITRTLMAAGFAVPMLIKNYQTLAGAIRTVAAAKGIDNLAEGAGLGATIKNTVALLGKTKATIAADIATRKKAAGEHLDAAATHLATAAESVDTGVTTGLAAAKQVATTTTMELSLATKELAVSIYTLLGPIGLALVAFGAVAAIGYAVSKAYDAQGESARKAAQAAVDAKQESQELTDSYNDLKTSLDELKNKESVLSGLTKGTREWNEAVMELNEQVLTLLDTYPQLAQYLENKDGVLSISNEGMESLLEEQLTRAQNAQTYAIQKRADASREQNLYEAQQLGREVGTKGLSPEEIVEAGKALAEHAAEIGTAGENAAAVLDKYTGIGEDNAAKLLENTAALLELNATAQGIEALEENRAKINLQDNEQYTNSDYQKDIDEVYNNRYDEAYKEARSKYSAVNTSESGNYYTDKYSKDDLVGIWEDLNNIKLTEEEIKELTREELIEKLAGYDAAKELAEQELDIIQTGEEIGRRHAASMSDAERAAEGLKNKFQELGAVDTETYKNEQAAIDKAVESGSVDGDDATALQNLIVANGKNMSDFFTQMADGSYKLKVDAEDFQKIANEFSTEPFKEQIRQAQEQINSFQGIEAVGKEGIDNFQWQSEGQQAQVDYLAALNYEDTAFLGEVQDKLNQGLELTKEEVRTLALECGKLAGEYDKVADKAQRIEETQAQTQQQLANSAKSIEELNNQYAEGLIKREQYNEALIAHGANEDVNAEYVRKYTEALAENAEELEYIDDALQDNEEAATGVAGVIEDTIEGIEKIQEAWDDWTESGLETPEVIEEVTDVLEDMFNTDIPDGFVTDHMDEIQRLAEGDITAIDDLRLALTELALEDITVNPSVELDTTDFDTNKQLLLDEINTTDWGTIQIGSDIDDAPFYDALNSMIQNSNMTEEQINALLSQIGYVPNIQYITVPANHQVASQNGNTYTYEVEGLNGEMQSVTLTENLANQVASGQSVTIPVITGSKFSGGGSNIGRVGGNRTSPSSGGGGGGGKGKPKKGGGKGKEYKPPKKKETKKDPYAEVNRELKQADRNLKELTQKEKKLTGQRYLDNLKKQNKELEKQLKYTREKNNIARKEIQRQQKDLAKTGLSFGADGEITNYLQMWDYYNKELERLYKKATAPGATEEDKARYEKAAEDFAKWEKLVDDYNKDLDIFKDTYNEYNDIIDEMVQNNIDRFNYTIDLKLETTDFEKDWKKFKQDVLLDIKDDDYVNLNNFGLSTMKDDLSAAKTGLSTVAEMQKQLKASQKIQALIEERDNPNTSAKRRAQIDKEIEKLSAQTPYYDNVAQLEEDIKKRMEDIMQRGEDIAGVVEDIHDNWMDAIDDTKEAFDNQLEQYESINEIIEHNLDLVEILHGDEAYKEMSKLYDKQAENTLKAAADSKKQQDFWKKQMNSVEKGSDAWLEYKKNWEDSVSETNKLTVESAKLFKEQYDAAIQGIGKSLKDNLMGGDAYKTNRNWENMLGDSDRYLDTLDRGNNMLALYNKGQDMMMNRTAKQQKELQKLMNSQTKNLENQTELRQIDFEIAQAELDLLEKQWALEDARNNKTKMRLRRDSQGNYRYQYVVDEDAVNKAQQEYMDALADLRAKEIEDYKDTASRFADAYEDYLERVNEIREQYAGDENKINAEIQAYEKEWLARNQKLVNDYEEMSGKVVQINGTMFNALSEQLSDEQLQKAMGVSNSVFDKLKTLYQPDGEIVSMVDGFATNVFQKSFDAIPQKTKEILQEATGLIPQVFGDVLNNDNWKKQVQNATKEITKAVTNEAKDLDRLSATVNQNFDNLVTNLDSSVKLSESFLANQAKLNDTYGKQLDTLKQQEQAAQNVLDMFRDAVANTNFSNIVGQYINRNYGSANDEAHTDTTYADADGYDTLAGAIYAAASKAEGGPTGSWAGDHGKFAVLHAHEYVLTEQDTQKAIDSINIMNTLQEQINSLQSGLTSNIGNAFTFNKLLDSVSGNSLFDQNVVINADFPAVESAREIKQAFDELVNMASQKVSKNRRVY